jgi:hypothetical protein
VSVERILFGGGVVLDGGLLPFIRAAAYASLNGYLKPLSHESIMDSYIRTPLLKERTGIRGALLLAMDII